ncbi:MAG: DUF262 domain-containing protein [Chloroflexota bacterium]|nr:DUF262 domain-containing protein [Chloroflexota bacterium]
MKDAQKPDHVSLQTLIDDIRKGQFEIPDFQREFEWGYKDILELMKSIFRDYYIGSLLLWKGNARSFEDLACEPIKGYQGGRGDRKHIVLDGQQRLSALYYAVMAPDMPAPRGKRRYLYFIQLDQFTEDFTDETFLADGTQRGRRILADDKLQYRHHLFPLAILGRGGWDLSDWFRGYTEYWEAEAEQQDGKDALAALDLAQQGRAFGDYVRDLLAKYQVSYVELEEELPINKICDIFEKLNSTGKPLAIFDLLNALLKPKDIQLKRMWRDAAPVLSFVQSEKMNVYILQTMSLKVQGYLSPRYLYYLLPGYQRPIRDADGNRRHTVNVESREAFLGLWDEAVTSLSEAIEVLRHPQEFGAVASKFFPYHSILPAFAALRSSVDGLPAASRLQASQKLRQWYWASVFTRSYSGPTESTAARDYREVRVWFSDGEAEPTAVREFREGFRSLDLRGETNQITAVYNGVFNLLVLSDAKDWMSGSVPLHDDLDDHHIVPQQWGRDNGLGSRIHSVLNRTPLTADTNRNVIGSRLPNEYLPELIQRNGEAMVRATLESHLISRAAFDILQRQPFTPDDFEDFISERQRTIQDAIESLLIKQRLDLPPQLRNLDADVEAIELALRRCIASAIDGDTEIIRGMHFFPKVRERLDAELRRNPARDRDYYATLGGMLEYFDLRELEDTIKNGQVWDRFAPRFNTKEGLATRFRQLADLRNAIRHSRTVDEVTRNDGEAAIHWFRGALR